MASPQIKNGYSPIANEILEQMAKVSLNGSQRRIIDVVWRFTYGFNRKEHDLSESFISKATGIHKKQVQRELNELIDMNFILTVKEASFNSSRVLKFNKDYEGWQITKKIPPIKKDTHTGSFLDTHTGSGLVPQENKYKTNIKTSTYTHDFEKFYSEYPRSEDKRRTFNNWKTCLKSNTVDDLMKACENYKKVKLGTEKRFLKSSANFLGKEKPFEDYVICSFEDNSSIDAPIEIIKAPEGWTGG